MILRIRKFVLSIVFSLVCCGLFAAKSPDWISGNSKSYPTEKFIVSIGEASTKTQAELKAVQGISAVFGQNIKSSTASSQRMMQAEKDGKITFEKASSVDSNILRLVNQDDMIGVEIADFYNDDAHSTWYVLAVLDRAKVAQIYKQMILKNYDEIKTLVNFVNSSNDKISLENYARLDFAEEIAKKIDLDLKRLSVINLDVAKQVEDKNLNAVVIHKILMDIAKQIPICVKVSNDSDGRISKVFEDCVSSAGFNVTRNESERYSIACDVYFKESASADGRTFFCEYSVSAAMKDNSTGNELFPLGFTGREGGNSAMNAQSRAKNKIAAKINENFKPQFNKYMQSWGTF